MKGGIYEYMTLLRSEAKCQNSNIRDSLLTSVCWSAGAQRKDSQTVLSVLAV